MICRTKFHLWLRLMEQTTSITTIKQSTYRKEEKGGERRRKEEETKFGQTFLVVICVLKHI